jgi:hypothetical protein
MKKKFAGEEKTFIQSTTGIAVSVAVLFATIWLVSKAWKAGQKTGI